MRLIDYLDKGASLGVGAPCLTMAGRDMSYGEVQRLTYRVARALTRSGVRAGDKVAILSGNDPVAFACVFAASRAGAIWCPINPRNEAAENRHTLDSFDCVCLIFASAYAPLVERIRGDLPKLVTLVCLDADCAFAHRFEDWVVGASDDPVHVMPADDVAMLAGTGGTTGRPKGVVLPGRSLEAMSAATLIGYPFNGRPCIWHWRR